MIKLRENYVIVDEKTSFFAYPCCVKYYVFAIWKDTNGPRRQIIVQVIEKHSSR